MADVQHFRLPDVGEGLTEAEIVSWKVKPGDTVKTNDVIVEIETAKSLVELPSPFAGTVVELFVEEGATVPVGTPIIGIATGAAATGGSGTSAGSGAGDSLASAPVVEEPAGAPQEDLVPPIGTPGDEQAVEPGLIGGPAPGGRTSVLVGYGPRSTEAKRRPRKSTGGPSAEGRGAVQDAFSTPPSRPVAPFPPPAPVRPVPAAPTPGVSLPAVGQPAAPEDGPATVLAKPPVRKLAKDLRVDLRSLTPTGPGGTVSREDVEQAAGAAPLTVAGVPRPGPTGAGVPSRSGMGWGEGPREERVAIRSVRKATAQAVALSAFSAPHVTEFLDVDATATIELVERLRAAREFRDVRITPLAVLARALCLAVRRTPEVNASWDEAAGEIVYKRYVNLGIAAATPRGLMVPNVKDADRLSLRELATAISELATTAREGRSQPPELAGGTISITNVGVFGVDTGTPILPPGEAAILAFGQIRPRPWVVDGQVVPRQVTTLGLSFDHRLVDGEQGSRFLSDIGRLLEDPGYALAWT